jgi:protease-4
MANPLFRYVSCLMCLGFAACADGSRAPKTDELREIVLRNAAPEERATELFSASRTSHREVLQKIDEAVTEPRIKGIFLRIGELGSSFARTSEIRQALLRVREAKKPVHCYFDSTDNSGYGLLAEVCDRIMMPPSGMLALTGLRAQSYYLRDLLERVGVTAELLQVGRFKGAADPLTRAEMAPEVRETMGALLDDLSSDLSRGVQKGRSMDAAAFQHAVDEGPHTAASALKLHLVDAIGFDDEARSKAKDAAKAKAVVSVLERKEDHGLGIGDLFDLFSDDGKGSARGERLVLAYVAGTIGESDNEGTDGVQSGPFVKAMRKYADDVNVKGVILRIDSPGGSALASDKMWHAVRRVAKRKPVIVSVGDMAASGGYYIACAGTEIFASPTSIVGSIGVVGGKIVAEKLAAQLGVHATTLVRGKNANWLSPTSRFSDSERAALQRALEETYGIFISRVREGRKLSDAEIATVAEGRIMSGKRATEGKLVDREGTLYDAIAHLRDKTGVSDKEAIEVWPKDRSVFSRLSNAMSGGSESRALLGQLLPDVLPKSPLASLLLSGDTKPLAVLPFSLELE